MFPYDFPLLRFNRCEMTESTKIVPSESQIKDKEIIKVDSVQDELENITDLARSCMLTFWVTTQ